MELTDYKVQLENFYGPYDLLLYLVKQEELNIYDIPIAQITQQYLEYLQIMKKLDINVSSDFLVVAATLMEIKAKALVPREEEPEEQDPRFELVQKLIEYKKYKGLSKLLQDLIQTQTQRFTRPFIEIELEQKEPLIELDLWMLAKTYVQLTKEVTLDVPSLIIYDDVPLEVFVQNILKRLENCREVTFSEIISDRRDRFNILKNFLASLELAHQRKISLVQEKNFEEIILRLEQNLSNH